jgi:hypothetical protein
MPRRLIPRLEAMLLAKAEADPVAVLKNHLVVVVVGFRAPSSLW